MIELTQTKFGRLEFIGEVVKGASGKPRTGLWRCECGAEKRIAITRVVNGYVASCGCLNQERTREANTKHGMRHSPEYSSWLSMKARCLDPDNKDYPRWGGRGVKICPAWVDSFEAFHADMGTRPAGKTLDRIDADGDYEPGNCRWATPREQSRNRRDLVVVNTPIGTMALVDYAASIGISKGAAHLRLRRNKLEGVTRV